MAKIGKRVRDLVRARLSAPAEGFNVGLASTCAEYGIVGFSLDFGGGKNFFLGEINPDHLEASSSIQYPLMLLYVGSMQDVGRMKPALFSGPVTVFMDVFLSWREASAAADFESLADAVEDAMVFLFNRRDRQDWGASVVYNGGIACVRGPVVPGASGWRRLLRFQLAFEVHTL